MKQRMASRGTTSARTSARIMSIFASVSILAGTPVVTTVLSPATRAFAAAATTAGEPEAARLPFGVDDRRPGDDDFGVPSIDVGDAITDAQLRAEIAEAVQAPPAGEGVAPATVAVEVLTKLTDDVAELIVDIGGSVTGSVDGAVVQGIVPARRAADLAVFPDVEVVRSPRHVSRPPSAVPRRTEIASGFGATVGQNVSLTNAAAWQGAGIDGSVKIGIIDYFDLGLWDVAEHGPVPDAAHRFCLDTSSDPQLCDPAVNDGVNNGDGFEHGVAVAQVLRDMAPAAEIFVASAATTSDTKAAIDWFAANGVLIITRSLGAAYDGPGDGTGPLGALVDYAASRNITWFNSAGNDAIDGYARITVPADLTATGGYVDFDNGPGVDTLLRLSGRCILFDGIRWSDWDKPAGLRSDYVIEAWAPSTNPDLAHGETYNPTDLVPAGTSDEIQANGSPPLEVADAYLCPPNNFGFAHGISYIQIKRKAGTPIAGEPDVLEIGLGSGFMELTRSQAASSAAKPVVDSRNPQLIAVGAVDPADGTGNPQAVASYSSQGPTNDGRIKPDVTAPSCVQSTVYAPRCFNGTSAASPTAAGMAALLLDAGVAVPGAPLAAVVRHFTFDRNVAQGSAAAPDGPDNKYGIGQVSLPQPPSQAVPVVPSAYTPVAPARVLDTRSTSPVGPPQLIGSLRPYGIIDVPIAGSGPVPASATAVAINLTSTDAIGDSYVQAVPYLRAPLGSSSTLNIGAVGAVQPNVAIVPIGVEGKISIFAVPGGNIIVDVLGYFAPTGDTVAAGRLVTIDPTRALDTRTSNLVPPNWVAHVPTAESVVVPKTVGVPATGVSALVLNVTSTNATGGGFLRAEPTGTTPATSTVNYVAGVASANTVIVPLGSGGTVSVFASTESHIVVDVTGYITDAAAPVTSTGRFVPLPTGRAYDSRAQGGVVASGDTRVVQLAGLAAPPPVVPAGATGVSINLTAADQIGPGFLAAYPSGGTKPATSTVNYVAARPVANGALLKLPASGALSVYALLQANVVIDINGYFTA